VPLLEGSPALSPGVAFFPTDQRGDARPPSGSDIGAFQGMVMAWTVDSTSDLDIGSATSGTLSYCIEQANTDQQANLISFDSAIFGTPQTINLGGTPLVLTDTDGPQVIDGPDAGVTMSGDAKSRVFQIDQGVTATITGLTITRGWTSGDGGGVLNYGTLTLTDSTLTADKAAYGGAIMTSGGSLRLVDCTIAADSAANSGGGIEAQNDITVISSTFTNDVADAGDGGAIDNPVGGEHTISIEDSILSGDSGGHGPEVANAVVSLGHNLVSNTADSSGWIGSDITGESADLGPLGDYGGPTQTVPLEYGSPGVGAGIAVAGVTTDQRGDPWPASGPDIGAFQGILVSVTNGNDSGSGSLRQAIFDVDHAVGSSSIDFPFSGTITPSSALPPITVPVAIEGQVERLQGDEGAPPPVTVDGLRAGLAANGLVLGAGSDGSTVTGLGISGFSGNGIVVESNDDTIVGNVVGAFGTIKGNAGDGLLIAGSGNLVVGDTIESNGGDGIDIGGSSNTVGGTAAGASDTITGNTGDGLLISGSANLVVGDPIQDNVGDGVDIHGSSNTIGGTAANAGDTITRNLKDGIFIASTRNLVEGDFIGTDASGANHLGNSDDGINIDFPISYNANNTVGGTTTGARNVISGNLANGLRIASSANLVEGNFIGTNVGGTGPLPNSDDGIEVLGGDNTIGATAGAVQVISGNETAGVEISTFEAQSNLVEGNRIGSDINATYALPNLNGVVIDTNARDNTIGGSIAAPMTGAGAGNVVSGNSGLGIYIWSGAERNSVLGNRIGTDGSGDSSLPNPVGVEINGASFNTVGGDAISDRNIIYGNIDGGVEIANPAAMDNVVSGNLLGLGADGGALRDAPSGQTYGVLIVDSSYNIIGGTASGAGNTLGGLSFGIEIYGSGSGDTIQGADNAICGNQIIGTSPSVITIPPSIGIGVYIENASDNTVGGTTTGAGNVITGYSYYGVYIYGTQATGNVVAADQITGSGVTGKLTQNGPLAGIAVEDSSGNTLGGTTPAAGNTISGNDYAGIYILGQGNTGTKGNYIGQNHLDHNAYGILLYNDTIDGSYQTLQRRNHFSGDEIAKIREFSGPVTSGGGSAHATRRKDRNRARRTASHPTRLHRPHARHTHRSSKVASIERLGGRGESGGRHAVRVMASTTQPTPPEVPRRVRPGVVVPHGPLALWTATRATRLRSS
jgi:hypothetical protein